MLPVGFGLGTFQGIIQENMELNGLSIPLSDVTKAMIIPQGIKV